MLRSVRMSCVKMWSAMEPKLLLILYTTCVSMHLHSIDSANIPRERSCEMGGEDFDRVRRLFIPPNDEMDHCRVSMEERLSCYAPS